MAPAEDARALKLAQDRLLALHRVSTLVAGQRQIDDVVREALRGAVSLLGAGSGAIFQFDIGRQVLYLSETSGAYDGPITPEVKIDEGVVGRTFARQAPITTSDTKKPSVAVVWIQLVCSPRLWSGACSAT